MSELRTARVPLSHDTLFDPLCTDELRLYIIPVTTPSECGSVRSVSRRARHRRRRRKAPCRDVDHVCLSRPMSLLEWPTDLLRRSASVAWPVRSMFACGGDAHLQCGSHHHGHHVDCPKGLLPTISSLPLKPNVGQRGKALLQRNHALVAQFLQDFCGWVYPDPGAAVKVCEF